MIGAEEMADRLGLKRHPRSWRGRCPACDYARTFSLKVGQGNRLSLFCASCRDRDGIRAAVAKVVGSDWAGTPPRHDEDETAARQRKQEAARKLWNGSEPIARTPAAAYLAARGVAGLAASPVLRFRADCHHPEGGALPAMVAQVHDVAGNPIAVHRTYLRRDGSGKADVEPPKASLGPVWGGAVRLELMGITGEIVVGEGIETSASAGLLLGLPAWAAVSAGNMATGMQLPLEVRSVVIAVDPGHPGERAAQDAAARWRHEGRTVRLARPIGGGDFNDVLLREGVPNG